MSFPFAVGKASILSKPPNLWTLKIDQLLVLDRWNYEKNHCVAQVILVYQRKSVETLHLKQTRTMAGESLSALLENSRADS